MVDETPESGSPESAGKGQAETEPNDPEPYDAIVVGAGLCGIIFMAYARKRGLRCVALEKQGDVGGLWKRLPAWQDIQNKRQDIALNGVPLDGVDQPAMHRYARQWVHRFGLEPHIRLNCEVTAAAWTDGGWTVRTKAGEVLRSQFLIVASGVQNEPWLPDVERSESRIQETHSFELQQPETLAGQRVAVVGGGTSSQDLLELAIEHGAKEVHWIYRRQVKWFLPTRSAKQRAWPNLRELGLGQSLHGTSFATTLMRQFLKFRYRYFGITHLAPVEPFDFDKHQLVPGRASLLQNLDAVSVHRSDIQSMRGQELVLGNGERFEADRVLWGTGYRMNLRYLDLPEYRQVQGLADLFPKLGSLVRALDYPNLFFVGMTLINSTSSTPFLAAVEAKTIVSHMRGECEIPEQTLENHLTYWDLIRYFASFDRANYSRGWKLKYAWLALWYATLQNRSIRV
ncbi:MAG: NAD(P)/FAD-dependent oxidoreductase [Gammaproteobacteria bacterium]|jgi:cation diffusion facilitator CzcD-associated flavoprotein CzcO